MSIQKTAREVIAMNLSNKSPPSAAAEFRADQMIKSLHAHGYVIIKDRIDPEGGIPGRDFQ
jgi:hypothetical protein